MQRRHPPPATRQPGLPARPPAVIVLLRAGRDCCAPCVGADVLLVTLNRATTPSSSLLAALATTPTIPRPIIMSAAGRVALAELDAVLHPLAGIRTVAVLGASYAGHRAVQVLAPHLPADWRLVVIERNTHAPHLYAFPRMTVVPGHEPKVFIPYDRLFAAAAYPRPPADGGHALIQAALTAVDPHALRVSFRPLDTAGRLGQERHLTADYIVYALGSELSDPINLWAPRVHAYNGSKADGVRFLQRAQADIQTAQSVLVVGGGALGVQMAGDIAERYPAKTVTLTHSRNLLPRFDPWMHEQASRQLEALGVRLVLGSRVDLTSLSADKRSIRLMNGQELTADLIVRPAYSYASIHASTHLSILWLMR